MIKFEFTMEDVDAENLMWAIRESALRNDEYIIKYMARQDMTEEQKEPYIKYFKDGKAYMLGLIEKMTNTRVEE
jgi:uncharacterized membrane protein YvbJ